MNSGYLIDHIRTTKANSPLMAQYLNAVLLLLSNPNYKIDIHIKGACWNKTDETASNHIKEITAGIPIENEIDWSLYDSYPGFSPKYTAKNILNCKVHICETKTPKDHAKIIVIKINGEICFYMLGSSNFSYSTYCDKNRKIGEADIAFIKAGKETNNLIKHHISNNNNHEMSWLISTLLLDDERPNYNDGIEPEFELEPPPIPKEITSSVSYDPKIDFDKWFENDFMAVRNERD